MISAFDDLAEEALAEEALAEEALAEEFTAFSETFDAAPTTAFTVGFVVFFTTCAGFSLRLGFLWYSLLEKPGTGEIDMKFREALPLGCDGRGQAWEPPTTGSELQFPKSIGLPLPRPIPRPIPTSLPGCDLVLRSSLFIISIGMSD